MPATLNRKLPLAAQVAALWRRLAKPGASPAAWLRPGPGLGGSFGRTRAVTAVMLGTVCAVVRLEARADGLHLVAADEGPASDLAGWKPLFKGSRGVLVLRSEERFLLTLDKPEVPEAELNLALRWPMGEALGTEPEQLLTMALPLPRVNEAVRAEVLGVATRLDTAQGQLASLRQAGIDVRSIDVIDSALRGMALLQETLSASTVAVCLVGNNMSIGLIQHGQISALRSVPLPEREGHADAELAEQLALNTRRTFDHYERKAMLNQRAGDSDAAPLAVGRALASVASLSQAGLDTFCTALPDAPQLFDVAGSLQCTEDIALRCAGNDQLTALACVAAARLFDTGPVARRAPATPAGLSTTTATTATTTPTTITTTTAAAAMTAAAPAASAVFPPSAAWTFDTAPDKPAARNEEAIT